jgi:hypothetical protein
MYHRQRENTITFTSMPTRQHMNASRGLQIAKQQRSRLSDRPQELGRGMQGDGDLDESVE